MFFAQARRVPTLPAASRRGGGTRTCALVTLLCVGAAAVAYHFSRGGAAAAAAADAATQLSGPSRVPLHIPPPAALTLDAASAAALARLETGLARVEAGVSALAAAPAPLIPTAPAPLRKSAVLGMAKDIEIGGAYRFVRSLRTHAPTVDIVIFTDAASLAKEPALKSVYELFGVKLITFDLERDVPAAARGYHPSSYRWLLMRDWMKAQGAEAGTAGGAPPYDRIMFSDARDTLFQGDIFARVEDAEGGGEGFYAFLEQRPKTIKECGWNAGWVKDCFGPEGLALVGDRVISCSGTSLGSWADAFSYADLMATTLAEKPECERNGIDQGMHNYFVHGGALQSRVSALYLIPNEEGFIATVQSMPRLQRDRAGRVLNVLGEVVSAVHQYDRSPALQAQYAGEYVWLDDAVLNAK